MIQKMLKYKSQIIFASLVVLSLALIRNYEEILFYDPFLSFFAGEFTNNPYPEVVEWKLYLNLFLRYTINSFLSIVLLNVVFKNSEFLKLATFLYILFFVVLISLFIIFLHYFTDRLMALFYIRRFIIQPLFLLLFIPGFYFQQQDLKKQKT